MSVTAPVPGSLNGAKLREELAAVGVAIAWDEMIATDGTLEFPSLAAGQQNAVRTVVAAHKGGPTIAEANRATILTAAQQALATNRTYAALANPTAAQTTAAVKALARQQNGIIRLLLGLLDATD